LKNNSVAIIITAAFTDAIKSFVLWHPKGQQSKLLVGTAVGSECLLRAYFIIYENEKNQ
jgi:hypothetical protein